MPDYKLINWIYDEEAEALGYSLFYENGEYHMCGRNLDTGVEVHRSKVTSWRAAATEWEDFTGLPAIPEDGEAA